MDAGKFTEVLKQAEVACDAALACYAELMLATNGMSSAHLKFGEAQSVLADVTEAMGLHVRSRHHLARAHAKALEIGERNALMPTAFGDTVPTYDEARDAPIATVTPIRAAA